MTSVLIHGGSQNGDFQLLKKLSKSGRSYHGWGCTKTTQQGDQLWFYIESPISAIVATGVALTDSKPGKNWKYETAVGQIEWIDSQITLEELKVLFPEWKWTKYPRDRLPLDEKKTLALEKRLNRTSSQPIKLIRPIDSHGSGFGDAGQNKKVEQAAVRYVKHFYKSKGYLVQSCESEKIGFDLLVTKGNREFHVEVKGVSGNSPRFIITGNESKTAMSDPLSKIAVVTSALTKLRKLKIISGSDLQKNFHLDPISYFATPK